MIQFRYYRIHSRENKRSRVKRIFGRIVKPQPVSIPSLFLLPDTPTAFFLPLLTILHVFRGREDERACKIERAREQFSLLLLITEDNCQVKPCRLLSCVFCSKLRDIFDCATAEEGVVDREIRTALLQRPVLLRGCGIFFDSNSTWRHDGAFVRPLDTNTTIIIYQVIHFVVPHN